MDQAPETSPSYWNFRANIILEYCKTNRKTILRTPPLNHVMRGASSGLLRAAKNQNLLVGTVIKITQGSPGVEHKPNTLAVRYVTISRSLIYTLCSFCQNGEYDNGWIINK